jgi:hypothetical protein
MKKQFFLSLLYGCLFLPLALNAQQIVSMPLTDAKTGATFTYNLGEEDVEALYSCYKMAKKEDGAADIVAKEAFRTLLVNHFVKNPKSTADHLRYVRLTSAALKLAEALGNKKDDKNQKEGRASQAVTTLLQELLPRDNVGTTKNK